MSVTKSICQAARQVGKTALRIVTWERMLKIDLVVEKKNGEYQATGGPSGAIFCGTGSSISEAVGSWFIANRERVNLLISVIEAGVLKPSTQYGIARSKDELGPNELRAREKLEQDPQSIFFDPPECGSIDRQGDENVI